MPLAPRCVTAHFPGSAILVANWQICVVFQQAFNYQAAGYACLTTSALSVTAILCATACLPQETMAILRARGSSLTSALTASKRHARAGWGPGGRALPAPRLRFLHRSSGPGQCADPPDGSGRGHEAGPYSRLAERGEQNGVSRLRGSQQPGRGRAEGRHRPAGGEARRGGPRATALLRGSQRQVRGGCRPPTPAPSLEPPPRHSRPPPWGEQQGRPLNRQFTGPPGREAGRGGGGGVW